MLDLPSRATSIHTSQVRLPVATEIFHNSRCLQRELWSVSNSVQTIMSSLPQPSTGQPFPQENVRYPSSPPQRMYDARGQELGYGANLSFTEKEKSDVATNSTATRSSSGKKGKWLLAALVVAGVLEIGGGTAVGLILANSKDDNDTKAVSVVIPETLTPTASPVFPTVAPTMNPTAFPTLLPSLMPSAEPTSESIQECTPLLSDHRSCLDKLTGFESSVCNSCLEDYLEVGTKPCVEWTEEFCDSIATPECQCGDCVETLRLSLDCFLGGNGCVGDCENLAPTAAPTMEVVPTEAPTTPRPCAEETRAYQTCYWTLPDDNDELCVDCINNIIATTPVVTCEDYNQKFCSQLSNDCEVCGWCRDELVTWTDCVIGRDQCDITCDGLFS